MSLHCWWFGCQKHPQDPAPVEFVACFRCGECIDYSDLVGDTRHYRAMQMLARFNPRRLWPRKCIDCGRRFKCDETIDHTYRSDMSADVAFEVEINAMRCIVFAATPAKARWIAVRAYWEAGYGSKGRWPDAVTKRIPLHDKSAAVMSDHTKAYSESYLL